MQILRQVTKYCGKEEKLPLFSLFHNIFNIPLTSGAKLHIHCEMWLFDSFFPQFCKSDMSRNGYRSISESPLDFEIMGVDCTWYISHHFYKVDNTCEFLFAFMHSKLSEMGSALKGKIKS